MLRGGLAAVAPPPRRNSADDGHPARLRHTLPPRASSLARQRCGRLRDRGVSFAVSTTSTTTSVAAAAVAAAAIAAATVTPTTIASSVAAAAVSAAALTTSVPSAAVPSPQLATTGRMWHCMPEWHDLRQSLYHATHLRGHPADRLRLHWLLPPPVAPTAPWTATAATRAAATWPSASTDGAAASQLQQSLPRANLW